MASALPDFGVALQDHYRLLRKVGQGGMAVVWLAQDLKHDRPVAIKILRPELAATLGPSRFLREIDLTARLTHPNILPLHDSGVIPMPGMGTPAGLPWYTMPYVEGESLRARLTREKQLPLEDALQIAREIADALGYAHAHNVLHRDIKPENILLEGVHAVVADFGIAKAISAAVSSGDSSSGLVVGTPAYMSPEQASGGEALDGRSDIYALGCVLYEMLAGQSPFTGSTPESVVRQHLAAPVPSVRVMRPGVPAALDAVITRALAKAPADRFRSAAEFRQALDQALLPGAPGSGARRRAGRLVVVAAGLALLFAALRLGPFGAQQHAASPAPEPPRIAVLYFEDKTADSSLQLFSDGLTEQLIQELGGLNAFRVISRNGVRPYRNHPVPFDSMVKALGVTLVIDGSVRRIGDTLQVGVDLIDAASGTNVDSVSVKRGITDFVSLERQLALQVAAALRRKMGREVRLRDDVAGTSSGPARELLLQARRARDEAEALMAEPVAELPAARTTLGRADSMLARAARADPKWLEPVVERGWVARSVALTVSGRDRVSALDRGLGFADEAMRRVPGSVAALQLRGTLRWHLVAELETEPLDSIKLGDAEADLRTTLDRDSTLASVWATLSYLLWLKGDFAGSALAAQRALREDAYLTDAEDVFLQAFFSNLMLGDFGQAGEWCRRGRLSSPGNWRFVECELTLMRHNRRARPDPDSAWALVRTLERLDPPERAAAAGRAYHTIYRRVVAATISALAGHRDSARAELARALAATAHDSSLRLDLAYDEAYLHLVMGDRQQAEQLLRTLVAARPLLGPPLARDPLFEGLRD